MSQETAELPRRVNDMWLRFEIEMESQVSREDA